MKILLKSLIVWILLLAVPFQGFASATMLMCAPLQSVPASATPAAAQPHDHHAMLAAHTADAGKHAPAGHHADHKCNSCASCCTGAPLLPSYSMRVPADTQNFVVVPFDSGFMPAVELAFPERPPKSS